MAIRIRRGTDAQRAVTLFLDGEIIWANDTQSFYVGDGVTLGGILIGPVAPGGLFVTTVNLVPPTLGNIQLTVSNSGTAGTLQWNALDLEIPEADTNTTGLLSFTDWNTFNSKVPSTRNLSINGVSFDLSADRTWSVGTVTSVALTLPSFLSVAGSPITGSGTFAVTLATQTANTIFAGPTTGVAATPTFRTMVLADLMSMTSAEFITKISDETGSGLLVFGTVPTLNQPNIVGTLTNDDAAAGSVGEHDIQSRLRSAAVALTTGVGANVTASPLVLTEGDYDITAMIGALGAVGTTLTSIAYSISLTSATISGTDTGSVPTNGEVVMRNVYAGVVVGASTVSNQISPYRITVPNGATVTLYLVIQAAFGVSTLSAFGSISKRRRRYKSNDNNRTKRRRRTYTPID